MGPHPAFVFQGHVEHARHVPRGHRFRTPVHFYAFDLSRLAEVGPLVRGFGWNRFAPLSLRDRDYLTEEDRPVREKLDGWLRREDVCTALGGTLPTPARVWLVTSARWWGYVFNPVSFYLLEDAGGELFALVAEVNNTFGDRHIYVERLEAKEGLLQAEHAKEFHVSPFNNLEGSYQFLVRREGAELFIGVNLYREGEKVLDAWMEGVGEPLTSRALMHISLRHPLRPWLTFPRIVWQAIRLRFQRKLTVYPRPEPGHAHTIRSRHRPVNP
jgi:cyclopropane-fatty-acyl-phospholipid synthase